MVGDALTDYQAAMANKVNFIGRVGKGMKSPFPKNQWIIADLTMLSYYINRPYDHDETESKRIT